MKLQSYGEEGIRIVYGDIVDEEIHELVRRGFYALKLSDIEGIIDIIPSFCSLVIHYDLNRTDYKHLSPQISEIMNALDNVVVPAPRQVEIPVWYGGEYGPDMKFVMSYTGLSEDEIVEIHTRVIYTVYAVGFMPGFPYLGVLDGRLFVPRLDTPRLKVQEGSVGIAQLQTGIYPFESPAGWRIIGKTDTRLFYPDQEPYSLLRIGDRVRFINA